MKIKYLIYVLIFISLAGCVQPALFYWGDYSTSLYEYKKNPDEKTLATHKKALQDIIAKSPQKRMQVPPGIYAEYGYMLMKEGKETEGEENFNKEISLYPESKVFIQRLKDELARGNK